tara:strand:- start:891 stop:1265 length:375 start_codon:yes stop_codon:yes gene_type:complete
MKITKSQLKQIIKEELESVIQEVDWAALNTKLAGEEEVAAREAEKASRAARADRAKRLTNDCADIRKELEDILQWNKRLFDQSPDPTQAPPTFDKLKKWPYWVEKMKRAEELRAIMKGKCKDVK